MPILLCLAVLVGGVVYFRRRRTVKAEPGPDGTPYGGNLTECPRCRDLTAYIDAYDGLLRCAVCRTAFYPDFRGYVRRQKTVPEPPR